MNSAIDTAMSAKTCVGERRVQYHTKAVEDYGDDDEDEHHADQSGILTFHRHSFAVTGITAPNARPSLRGTA